MRNKQRIRRSNRMGAPKRQKAARQYNATKAEVNGIFFDSKTEGLYYIHLLSDLSVKAIELQPEFQIIEPYTVACKRCTGTGKRVSPKTDNLINCTLCRGKGKRSKTGARYTADFKVLYIDGSTEVIDIKGGPVTRDFPLRRKLFEKKTGMELIVIRMKDKKWVRE